jgi:thioesterase domain-containing protein
MDLTVDSVSPGGPAAQGDETTTTAPSPQAVARLFGSIRAGRSWLRAHGAAATAPNAGALVPMKPGEGGLPLFMIPGAPGSILQLGPLALEMPAPMPVYAIKPRGFDGVEMPCETIRDMADHGIAAIRGVRPAGPYLLLGYSAGGLVALEMAHLLTAAGQAVPLVVLIDSYPGRRFWSLRCHVEILGRQTFRALWALRRYSLAGAWREARRRLGSLANYLAASGVRGLPTLPVVVEGTSAASRRVHLATYNAGVAYRPARYDGRVMLVNPDEVPDLLPRSPVRLWRRFLGNLDVRRVPGTTHLGMVEGGAVATAATIRECLTRAGFAFNTIKDATMSVKATIVAEFERVAGEQGKTLVAFDDRTMLLDTGLDSLCFAIIVARLEDGFGFDPFQTSSDNKFPVTFGDFVRLYETAVREHSAG